VDVRAERGDDGTLRRIIALLVALAALAERAGSHPTPIRILLLWVLRRAEAVAGAFVFEATGAPLPFGGVGVTGNGRADALSLAARFRALAIALGTLLSAALRRSGAFAPVPPRTVRPLGALTPEPSDTS
jgi:hypothetical protein